MQLGPAYADTVPTHGQGPHLNPFRLGWNPPDLTCPPWVAGPAANGTCGELVMPFTAGTPWSPPYTAPAFDAINNFGGPDLDWHWESEIDVPGLNGWVMVNFFGRMIIPVFFAPGVDIYLDVHQFDLGNSPVALALPGFPMYAWGACGVGFAETGSVCKQLINLTPFQIAWGTSVTETPGQILASEKRVVVGGDEYILSDPNTNHNVLRVSGDQNGLLIEEVDIPEPATLVLAGLGLGVLVVAWRRKRPTAR